MQYLVGAAILGGAPPAARANDLIRNWARITAPPAPLVHKVTLDPKTTALLLLDFVTQTCSNANRPQCVATIPAVRTLLATARANHATIIYSYVLSGTKADINAALKPRPGEASVQSGPDKFLHTNLARILRRNGIKTVIVTGTAAEGAVLATASEAAYRNYTVIVPYNGMSSTHPYAEQYVAWDLLNAPATSQHTIFTSLGLIRFGS
ncbi:cysteine hydrolase [Acidiphilium sp. PA]|uniref:isochorismatase family protein n=1 Tax=Acidiphilium sp. PA TaxID=2871705 RepID=UPI002244983F|nr:isochorismatase family protein [Acidiphilium sp. PA]MCW8306113.1 cysteine hydrolase [Acidiphilium sp. PA]